MNNLVSMPVEKACGHPSSGSGGNDLNVGFAVPAGGPGRVEGILDTISDAFAALDHGWRFAYANRRYLDLMTGLGVPAGEILGKSIWEVFPALAESAEGSFYQRVMAGQRPESLEIRHAEDAPWLEVHAYPSPELLSLHLRDISARRRSEEALQKRSHRMQLLSEALGQLISARDPETIVRDLFAKVADHLGADAYFNFMVNETGDALHLHSCAGIPEQEVRGLHRLEFGQAICGRVAQACKAIVATDIQHSQEEMSALVRGYGIQCYACNPLMVGGRLMGTLSFASRSRVAFDEDELEFVRVVSQHAAIAMDRLRTNRTESETAGRLALALAAADLGDWHWEAATDAMVLSPRAAQIYGVEPGGHHTRARLRDLLHDDDRERARAAAKESTLAGRDYDIEYRVNRPDGTEVWVAARGRALRSSTGTVTGMLGVVQDITSRKVAEAALHHAKETAESASRAKDRFLAVLSHELRTPLTPVLMAVTALEGDELVPEAVREQMAMIRRNVDLETKLIDDLLDISRITSGKLVLKMEEVDINRLAGEACSICLAQMQPKNIDLEILLDENAGRVSADPARLLQVLWNLLNNAVKFTPLHGRLRVSTARTEGNRVRVEVTDSGKGIAPDLLPHVFDAFEQGDARVTDQFGGLGLGLAISEALMRLHHGSISATSEGTGKGATFIIELPAVHVSEGDQGDGALSSPAEPQQSQRLLVVEDHADTAQVLGILLRRAGFEVVIAGTVAQAAGLVQAQVFDAIISDLGLPDGSGHDLMRQVRKTSTVPAVAMSGFGMEEDIRRSAEAGFNEHLVKPVSLQKLRQALGRAFAGKM